MEKQVIKGFIEVTRSGKEIISISDISRFHMFLNGEANCKIFLKTGFEITCEETYEQVIQLIQESLSEDKLKQYQ